MINPISTTRQYILIPSSQHKKNIKPKSGKQSKGKEEFPSSNTFSVKKILIPTDFSDLKDSAMVQATSLAKKFKAEILLIHLLVPQSEKTNLMINIIDLLAEDARQTMADMLTDFREKYPDLKVNGVCEEGELISGINIAVLDHKADMVILSVNSNNLNEAFSGRKTSKVFSDIVVPVLMVADTSIKIVPQNIICISEQNILNDSSLSMIQDLFGHSNNFFYLSREDDKFAISKIKNNSIDNDHNRLDLTSDDYGKNLLSEGNMDLLVLLGSKRQTWTRFLRSQTGQSLAQNFNVLILIWAGQ